MCLQRTRKTLFFQREHSCSWDVWYWHCVCGPFQWIHVSRTPSLSQCFWCCPSQDFNGEECSFGRRSSTTVSCWQWCFQVKCFLRTTGQQESDHQIFRIRCSSPEWNSCQRSTVMWSSNCTRSCSLSWRPSRPTKSSMSCHSSWCIATEGARHCESEGGLCTWEGECHLQ